MAAGRADRAVRAVGARGKGTTGWPSHARSPYVVWLQHSKEAGRKGTEGRCTEPGRADAGTFRSVLTVLWQ